MKAKSIEVLRFFIFHSIHFYLQQMTTLYQRGLQDTKKQDKSKELGRAFRAAHWTVCHHCQSAATTITNEYFASRPETSSDWSSQHRGRKLLGHDVRP